MEHEGKRWNLWNQNKSSVNIKWNIKVFDCESHSLKFTLNTSSVILEASQSHRNLDMPQKNGPMLTLWEGEKKNNKKNQNVRTLSK